MPSIHSCMSPFKHHIPEPLSPDRASETNLRKHESETGQDLSQKQRKPKTYVRNPNQNPKHAPKCGSLRLSSIMYCFIQPCKGLYTKTPRHIAMVIQKHEYSPNTWFLEDTIMQINPFAYSKNPIRKKWDSCRHFLMKKIRLSCIPMILFCRGDILPVPVGMLICQDRIMETLLSVMT